MLCYLAGPMRGFDQFNFPAFDAAAMMLREHGLEVLSPAEHDRLTGFDETLNSLDGFDMGAAFRWDVESVLSVDLVVLLPGWQESKGAIIEKSIAMAIGIPVFAFRDRSGGTYTLTKVGE